jgi:signal transduction histidine kinase
VLILGLLLLLALLRCAYLEVENRRLGMERAKLLRQMHRSASQLRAMAAETRRVSHEARVTDEITTAMAANLRPVGNVDLVPSNVVAFPGREEPSS